MIPRISVVIPAFNEEYELPKTLAAFELASRSYRQAFPNNEIEFIVVDNASTDSTAAIAQAWGARVVHEPQRQIARARNSGAKAAVGEILITCDADSLPHPLIFGKIESELKRGVFAGGVRIWAKPLKLAYSPVFIFAAIACFVGRLPGGMFFIRRQDFLDIGGFDESFFALEDVDFAVRLKREAKKRSMKLVILWKYPILTSTRKLRLCSVLGILKMSFLAAVHPKKYLKDRSYWEKIFYSPKLREKENTSI